MRLTDQIQKRARRSEGFEALPSEPLRIDYEKHFRFIPPDNLKRRVMHMVAPTALSILQPIIRRRVGCEFEIPAEHWSWSERFVWDAVQQRLIRAIEVPNADVLIQGCWLGDSSVQTWMRRGAKSVTGIELYNLEEYWKKSVPALQAHYGRPLEIRQASVDRLPFADSSFNVVESSAVYEHVFNLSTAMKEAARVLKPGGFAVHSIGPLYFSFGGDHCSGQFGLEEGYAHLLDDEADYQRAIKSERFRGAADPDASLWAQWEKFSFARVRDYVEAWRPWFDPSYLVFVIAPDAVRFRNRFPDRYSMLKSGGLSDMDLLVTGIKVLLKKKNSNVVGG